MIAYDGIRSSSVTEPMVWFGTLTAPGVGWDGGRLRWDRRRCTEKGSHGCSGKKGRKPRSWESLTWNLLARGHWRRLRAEIERRVKRELGHGTVLLIRAWELQARGLLHIHFVLGYSTPREQLAANLFAKILHETDSREREFFGFDHGEPMRPESAGVYVASYFAKKRNGKLTIHDTVDSGAVPRCPIYVATRLSQASGLSMRNLRLRRFAHHLHEKAYAGRIEYTRISAQDVFEWLRAGYWRPGSSSGSCVSRGLVVGALRLERTSPLRYEAGSSPGLDGCLFHAPLKVVAIHDRRDKNGRVELLE